MSLNDVEQLIAADHPVRVIKCMCNRILRGMDEVFDGINARDGAPSVPPETLLKGKVLQALYTVRSDGQLCARLQTDLTFRWFVDLPLDAAVFDPSTYSKNRQRLLGHEVADVFFAEVVELAREHAIGCCHSCAAAHGSLARARLALPRVHPSNRLASPLRPCLLPPLPAAPASCAPAGR